MEWEFAEAKEHLSEVVARAFSDGPQRIRVTDQSVIMIAESEFQLLTAVQGTLKDAILNGPDLTGLDLTRDSTSVRDID